MAPLVIPRPIPQTVHLHVHGSGHSQSCKTASCDNPHRVEDHYEASHAHHEHHHHHHHHHHHAHHHGHLAGALRRVGSALSYISHKVFAHSHVHPSGNDVRPERNTGRACNCQFIDIDELGYAGAGARAGEHQKAKWHAPDGASEIGVGVGQGFLGGVAMWFGAQNFRAAGQHLKRYKEEKRVTHEKTQAARAALDALQNAPETFDANNHAHCEAEEKLRNLEAHTDVVEHAVGLQEFSRWAAGALPFATGAMIIAGIFFPPLAVVSLFGTMLYCILHTLRYTLNELPQQKMKNDSTHIHETDECAKKGMDAMLKIQDKRRLYYKITAVAFAAASVGASLAMFGMIAGLLASPAGPMIFAGAVILAAFMLVTVYTNNSRILKDAGTRTDQAFGLQRETMGDLSSIARRVGYLQDEENRLKKLKDDLRAEGLTTGQRAINRMMGLLHGFFQIVPIVRSMAHRRHRHLVHHVHASSRLNAILMASIQESQKAEALYLADETNALAGRLQGHVFHDGESRANAVRLVREMQERLNTSHTRVAVMAGVAVDDDIAVARVLWDFAAERGEHGYPWSHVFHAHEFLEVAKALKVVDGDELNFEKLCKQATESLSQAAAKVLLQGFIKGFAQHWIDGYRAEISYQKLACSDHYRARQRRDK